VDVKFRFSTEKARNGEVMVSYILTNLNFADIMTKELVPKKHKDGVELIEILVHLTVRDIVHGCRKRR
jgi:hypothetical protein